jgi:hypothetical protein
MSTMRTAVRIFVLVTVLPRKWSERLAPKMFEDSI